MKKQVIQVSVSKEEWGRVDYLRMKLSMATKQPIISRSSFIRLLLFPALSELQEDLER